MPQPLNILYIQVDQMTASLTELYGHPVVRTPNLKKLAERGVRFDSAYSSCPVCGPARMSMLTGRYVSDIDCFDNASPLRSDEPTYAHYLTNNGYETVVSGKMHMIGPDQLHGFKRRLTTDVYPSDFGWTPDFGPNASKKPFGNPTAKAYRPTRDFWNFYLDYDEETSFRAREFLRSKRPGAATAADPFCLVVSFHHPHEPFQPPIEYWNMYTNADIVLPVIPPDMTDRLSPMDRWLNRYHGLHDVAPFTQQEWKDMRQGYYGVVTYVDKLIGDLIDDLDRFGLTDSTAIIFVSDHGEMLGERGMIQKRHFYENSVRVPMVLALPPGHLGVAEGSTCATPVSLLDTVPTILSLANTNATLPVEGTDLTKLIGHPDNNRAVIAELPSEGVETPCFMVRRNQWKYCYFHGHGEQLFDLVNDPDEWNDLSGDHDHSPVRDELRNIILNRFDPDEILERVERSKKKRFVIQDALLRNETHWDYQPLFDATRQYRRGFGGI